MMESSKSHQRYFLMVSSVVIVVAVAAAVIMYTVSVVRAKYQQLLIAKVEFTRAAERIDNIIHYDELTHWQREEWEIETFFHTPEAIAACELISAKKTLDLNKWIDIGGDINLTGDHGMTLLFWAMLDRNIIAFQHLLSRGADPDLVLTEGVPLKNGGYLFRHDSVMFAATTLLDFDFMLTALPYTDDPDQRDSANQNLLLRLTCGFRATWVRPYVFAELVRAGVNPDVRNDRGGFTPAVGLASEPAKCLAMLIAGADPEFESANGDTVIGYVRHAIEINNPIVATPEHQRLVKWLVRGGYLESKFLPGSPLVDAEEVLADSIEQASDGE